MAFLDFLQSDEMAMSPKSHIKVILLEMKIKFVEEHKFLDNRRFKFDWAIPDKMIAIEYEGLFAKKGSGKSRHTTATGYSKDSTKYNLAAINGWTVLRYTAMTYKNIKGELEMALNG